MTADAVPETALPPVIERDVALRLAGLHLRTGSLALARAELETLAGRDLLDDPGIVDLAEVRWRTGDVAGAGEAIAALMDPAQGGPPSDEVPRLAYVIAAEAAAARGRPTEARRHADHARSADGDALDVIFAGLPRSSVWPPDPLDPAPYAATMFPAPAGAGGAGHAGHDGRAAGIPSTATLASPTSSAPPADQGFWDADADAQVADPADATDPDEDAAEAPSPGEEFELGRAALEDGDLGAAAIRLGLVLRFAPALAPAVLDALGDRHDDDPALALVRGDAYRLVGHERDARRAYARARPTAVHLPAGPESATGSDPQARPDAGADTEAGADAGPIADLGPIADPELDHPGDQATPKGDPT